MEAVGAMVGAIEVGAVVEIAVEVLRAVVEAVKVVTDVWAAFFGRLFGLVAIHTSIISWNGGNPSSALAASTASSGVISVVRHCSW